MRRFLFPLIFFVCGLFAVGSVQGQESTEPASVRASIKIFRNFTLGLSLDEVKSLLAKDPYFNYRGDPDVYFLPAKEQLLIECSGNMYIRRAYFQFVDKRLFTVILDLDGTRVDYFTMLSTFNKHYGEYVSFSPRAVVWEKGGIRLALEKPLTVKYIDLAVFERLKVQGRAQETDREKSLKDFLSEF